MEKLKQLYGLDKYGKNVPDWAEEVKYEFVDSIMGEKIKRYRDWIENFQKTMETAKEKLGIKDFILSKEMRSFLEDPRRHLVKKLFLYFHDLIRGNMSPEEFVTKGRQAINSSFGSNLRSIYQLWGLLSLMLLLYERGFRIAYPEHKVINLDRMGMQKAGSIPPNVIMEDVLGRSFSFFIEAPRPIGWEDGSDLERVWKLYSTLRPDMLIYKGFVTDIVDLSGDIPIKRPNYIVEFKELDEWWKRWRYLKGYKPFTVNEWRARWIKGLYEGLAEVLGKKPEDLPKFEEGEVKRIKEYKIIELYINVYHPDLGVLVSRTEVGDEVKKELKNVMVIDNVRFESEKLEPLMEEMTSGIKVDKVDIKELAYKYVLDHYEDFKKWLREKLGITIG